MQVQTVGGRLSRRSVVGGLAGLGATTAGLVLASGCGPLPFAPQPMVAHIGYVWTGNPLTAYLAMALRDGLRDAGWVDGQTWSSTTARTESTPSACQT
jgi:hypothetical protein